MTEQRSAPRRWFYVLDEHRTPEGDYIPVMVTEDSPTLGVMSGNGPHAQPWRWGKTRFDAMEICHRTNRREFGLSPEETLDLMEEWSAMMRTASVLCVGDGLWPALTEHGWAEGEQALSLSPDGDRVTACASQYTRDGDTLGLTALNSYEVAKATLNGEPLATVDEVWVAVTGHPKGHGAAVLDPRQAIEAETRHSARTLLYTEPVLTAAAGLLADVWAAGERHGVQPSGLDVAFACLEAMRPRWSTGGPGTNGEVRDLLQVLVEEFATLGVTATLDVEMGLVVLPREESTPTWGYDHPADPPPPPLAVTAVPGQVDGGWDLVLNRRGMPKVEVAAPCDRTGVVAVAQLAIEVNAGRRGNPFRR